MRRSRRCGMRPPLRGRRTAIVVGMRRAGRSAGLALVALFLVVRTVVEVATVDPLDPASYRDDWGGPTYLGALGVHAGPGLVVLTGLAWSSWRAQEKRRRS